MYIVAEETGAAACECSFRVFSKKESSYDIGRSYAFSMSEEYFYNKKRSQEVMKYFDKDFLDAFSALNSKVFKEGRLSKKFKELIAVACAYDTRCPWCIEGHTKAALKAGATKEEIAEAIAIAAALSAGAVFAHRNFALDVKQE